MAELMRLDVLHNEALIVIDVEPEGDHWRVRLPDGTEHRIGVSRTAEGLLRIHDGERVFSVPTARTKRGVEAALDGQTYLFQSATGRSARRQKRAPGALTAPMAGIVADVLVTVGQTVAAYQPLAAVEAMKVYATVEAPSPGTVTAVHVQKGRRVEQGTPVVDIAPTEEATP